MKEKEQTVTGLLEEIVKDFCNNYCKYPCLYTDEDEMIEVRCERCPLNKI